MTHTSHLGLIWATLPTPLPQVARAWMGIGLLSEQGLPLDVLPMLLAAKMLHMGAGASHPITVLLADAHAVSADTPQEVVQRRVAIRRREVQALGDLLAVPITTVCASSLDGEAAFVHAMVRVRHWLEHQPRECRPPLHPYTVRGIADALYFCRAGGVKVGWSVSSHLHLDRGGHHEFETDAHAREIDPVVSAVYVRHGVTLDSTRPKAVPYTESLDPRQRLMLTGAHRGQFAQKLCASAVTPKRRHAVLQSLRLTVSAFHTLVGDLEGATVVEQAEAIVERLDTILGGYRSGQPEQPVNLLADACAGSTPAPPTSRSPARRLPGAAEASIESDNRTARAR